MDRAVNQGPWLLAGGGGLGPNTRGEPLGPRLGLGGRSKNFDAARVDGRGKGSNHF